MESILPSPPANVSLFDNDTIRSSLIETSKWAKFLAIMGYIGIGFLLLFGLVATVGLSLLGSYANMPFPMGLFGLMYLVVAVIYYFPVTFLYRFSVRMRKGLASRDVDAVTSGFENLRMLYKFKGIVTIIVLALYLLAILIAVPMAIWMRQATDVAS
jgi:hypothetical protein